MKGENRHAGALFGRIDREGNFVAHIMHILVGKYDTFLSFYVNPVAEKLHLFLYE